MRANQNGRPTKRKIDNTPATDVKKPKTSGVLKRSKSAPKERTSGCFFYGVHAFFIACGISRKRLQVWQTRFTDLGGIILESATASFKACDVVYVLAADATVLAKEVDLDKLKCLEKLRFVEYRWIEDCLKDGQLLSCHHYMLLQIQKQTHTKGEERIQLVSKADFDTFFASPRKAREGTVEDVPILENKTKSAGTDVIKEAVQETKTATEGSSAVEDEQNLQADEAPDYNKHVAGPLKEMSNIYADFFGDEWRAFTYRKVANKIDKLPYKISSSEELKNIQGIGKSMIDKIKEILCSGQLQKLINLKADPQVQIIQQFASVWGIGPKHARRLYQAGYRSLQDIRQDPSLPSLARVGLKYHDDIVLRIPRAEVAEAGVFVHAVLENLCPGAWLTVGGSYRRGQPTCGDIDLLITHPDGRSHDGLMSGLVGKLQEMEFLSGCSTATIQNSLHRSATFMGICRLPQHCHHRRIDIKIYPKEVYAFALVYFTGNDVLNRRIRYFARTKGYKLNDLGLFQRVGYGRQDVAGEVSIPCETEQEIFEKLGLPYPEPEDRNW